MATVFLQRLLRGRACQNSMFEGAAQSTAHRHTRATTGPNRCWQHGTAAGKERRIELIKELRLVETVADLSTDLHVRQVNPVGPAGLRCRQSHSHSYGMVWLIVPWCRLPTYLPPTGRLHRPAAVAWMACVAASEPQRMTGSALLPVAPATPVPRSSQRTTVQEAQAP